MYSRDFSKKLHRNREAIKNATRELKGDMRWVEDLKSSTGNATHLVHLILLIACGAHERMTVSFKPQNLSVVIQSALQYHMILLYTYYTLQGKGCKSGGASEDFGLSAMERDVVAALHITEERVAKVECE